MALPCYMSKNHGITKVLVQNTVISWYSKKYNDITMVQKHETLLHNMVLNNYAISLPWYLWHLKEYNDITMVNVQKTWYHHSTCPKKRIVPIHNTVISWYSKKYNDITMVRAKKHGITTVCVTSRYSKKSLKTWCYHSTLLHMMVLNVYHIIYHGMHDAFWHLKNITW